jgi:hypothetical protein
MSRLPIVFVAATILLLSWQLMLPPVVGLANNGDFPKMLGHLSLGTPGNHPFEYADTTYEFDGRYHWDSRFRGVRRADGRDPDLFRAQDCGRAGTATVTDFVPQAARKAAGAKALEWQPFRHG